MVICSKKKGFILSSIIILSVLQAILLLSNRMELAYYNFLLLGVFILFYLLSKKIDIPKIYLAGFVLVALLNAVGGLVFINGIRLYDAYFGFFKLDMIMHFISMFFTVLLFYHILVYKFSMLDKKILLLIVALSSFGIGALFEVFEFAGIIFFKNQGVGDYFNNALDLVFDLIGIFVASLYIYLRNNF